MLYLDKKAIIISLLPIFPLLDFFMFSDFPWITIISYVIICLVFGSWEWKCDYLVFFSYMYDIMLNIVFNNKKWV